MQGFYQYFNGKDELLLALVEEPARESIDDLRAVIESETEPLARLRAFVICLHEWCDPEDTPRKRGTHNRRPISEFSVQLAGNHPDRVKAALSPISDLLVELLDDAPETSAIEVIDRRRTSALVRRTVMYSWFGNRLAQNARAGITPEDTWEFCLQGLHGHTDKTS